MTVMSYQRRLFCILCLALALPCLQGAGCRAHYSARLNGTLIPAGDDVAAAAGKPILVVYRDHDGTPCTASGPCLTSGQWLPLRACGDKSPGTTDIEVVAGQTRYDFDACTNMVGVDYKADLAAFIDLNGDGQMSAGEPVGVYSGNPMYRSKEKGALPLEIKIDQRVQ